jgi:hypothetical protein
MPLSHDNNAGSLTRRLSWANRIKHTAPLPLDDGHGFPRLIDRNLPFGQSKNTVKVVHRNSRKDLYRLLSKNWFHVFLRQSTSKSLLILITLWTSMILVFAGLYHAADRARPTVDCGLGGPDGELITYYGSFAFSLETCTTVGYGLPGGTNAFFENCPEIQTVIYFQMLISMMSNAFLFAFFFASLARCESRAIQVVFSKTCVVRITERGTIVCQVQVYDVDSGHAIVEAHVRLYALMKDKDSDGHPQLLRLRTQNPNDELGGMLFLSIPSVVTHEIDCYSPLQNTGHAASEARFRLPSGGLELREVDSIISSREEIMCPVCGESYGDFRRLRKHFAYQQLVEKVDNYPIKGAHRELELDEIPARTPRPSLQELKEKLPLQELICVVEGIDPLTSGTFQALQSYTPEDIEWGARFVPCLTSTTALSSTFVDLELFHKVEPVVEGQASNVQNDKQVVDKEDRTVRAANESVVEGQASNVQNDNLDEEKEEETVDAANGSEQV